MIREKLQLNVGSSIPITKWMSSFFYWIKLHYMDQGFWKKITCRISASMQICNDAFKWQVKDHMLISIF